MDFNEYQKLAISTRRKRKDLNSSLAEDGLCIAGEAGELANKIKKIVYHGHKLEYDDLVEELGDLLWYIAVIAESLNFDLETVAQLNVFKLAERYPGGFSSERSINRSEATKLE